MKAKGAGNKESERKSYDEQKGVGGCGGEWNKPKEGQFRPTAMLLLGGLLKIWGGGIARERGGEKKGEKWRKHAQVRIQKVVRRQER